MPLGCRGVAGFDKQADIIDAFNTTSRNLDDILNINNIYFDNYGKSNIPFRAQIPLIPRPRFRHAFFHF